MTDARNREPELAPLLSARNISRSFGKGDARFLALDDVSLEVGPRECVGLIGESGSGKSTLANIVVGLDQADSGSCTFLGTDLKVTERPNKRGYEVARVLANMQMVFQNPASSFSERMKVGRGIMDGLAFRKDLSRDQRRRLMLESLDAVGLPRSYADKHAWELSGGECQRAAIARAIISRPKLLICDEPTSALDVTVQAQIISLLVSLIDQLSMSCLFISHDLVLVRGFCSRISVMDEGRIVESGPTEELFASPKEAYTRQLLDAVISL
jgi:ABC-type glutathione transport system ATPase component